MESAVPILIVSAVIVALFVRFLYEVVAHKDAIQAIAELTDAASVITNERDEAIAEFEKVTKERDDANQTIANLMGDISIVRMERQGVVEELGKVTKERDELQAKLCKIKDNDIELLNLKIYKERVLARLKSIIDDEVDESFHS